MISADNAHAIHPNHQDCSDPVNHPYLNGGIVIKFNANQNTAQTDFLLRYFVICAAQSMFLSNICQPFRHGRRINSRNISNTQVAVDTVDIGLPQLAMHSPTRRQEYTIPTILSKLQPNFSVEQRKKSKI